jgi:hypothetical protein
MIHKLPHHANYGTFISSEVANKMESSYWLDKVNAHKGFLKVNIQFSALYYNSVVSLLFSNTTEDSTATNCSLEGTECHFKRQNYEYRNTLPTTSASCTCAILIHLMIIVRFFTVTVNLTSNICSQFRIPSHGKNCRPEILTPEI